MRTKDDLEAETRTFFELHWHEKSNFPVWNFDWKWAGAIPNYDLGGVYALFSTGQLIYIGLGASRGGGNYVNRGISNRLLSHVIRGAVDKSKGGYEARERWQELSIDLIATIGFPLEFTYLSCALEDFLIGKLDPPENRMKRSIKGSEVTAQRTTLLV